MTDFETTVKEKWDALTPVGRMVNFGYSNCPTVRKEFDTLSPVERQQVMVAAEHTVPRPRALPEKQERFLRPPVELERIETRK